MKKISRKDKVYVQVREGFYVSVTQAGKVLGMSRPGVNIAIQRGSLKAYKIGEAYIINIVDVNEYAERMNKKYGKFN